MDVIQFGMEYIAGSRFVKAKALNSERTRFWVTLHDPDTDQTGSFEVAGESARGLACWLDAHTCSFPTIEDESTEDVPLLGARYALDGPTPRPWVRNKGAIIGKLPDGLAPALQSDESYYGGYLVGESMRDSDIDVILSAILAYDEVLPAAEDVLARVAGQDQAKPVRPSDLFQILNMARLARAIERVREVSPPLRPRRTTGESS